MSARHKLNQIYVLGSVLVALIVGGVAQSWLAFFVAAVVLIAVAVHGGDVRLKSGRRRR